jgi:hypothetical protein
MTVRDGPLGGEVFELDLAVDEQVKLRLPDGGSAVYRAAPDRDHPDSTGNPVLCLALVADLPPR